MHTLRNIVLALLVFSTALVTGEQIAEAQFASGVSQPPLDDKSDLRRWLRRRLSQGASNRERERIRDRLDDMKKSQLQSLAVALYRQDVQRSGAYGGYGAPYGGYGGGYGYGYGGGYSPYYPGRVTYVPQVTWLPSGVSLGANAVVSPDRRHVRMSLSPSFYSIPRVDTYNLQTGERRRVR
jgi:hypothetical protein